MTRVKKSTARATPATTHDVRLALRRRFPAPGWALIEEVRNTTGYARKVRSADALAMSLWPSRGLELHGFEIKVSRGDWRREINDPEKAEVIARYCDRWWVVLGSRELAKDHEIPPAWGVLALDGADLVLVKDAGTLEAAPIDRRFLAAVLRVAMEDATRARSTHISPEEAQRRVDEALAREDASRRLEWEREAHPELGRLRHQVEWAERFEEATGIQPGRDRWTWGYVRRIAEMMSHRDVGDGIRRLSPVEALYRSLGREEDALAAALERTKAARADLAALAEVPTPNRNPA